MSSSLDLRIVPAGVKDVPILARHRCAMFLEMGSIEASHRDDLFARSSKFLTQSIGVTYFAFLASPAAEPAKIAGGVGVLVRPLMPRPTPDHRGVIEGEQGLILNMYVEHAYRRRGVGRALLRHVLGWCRERSIRSIVLHASNAGRPMYESEGFQDTSEMALVLPFEGLEVSEIGEPLQ
jgi:GNAT superfamily N-acetyltransferase